MKEIKSDFYSTLFNRIFVYVLLFVQGIVIARWLGPEGKGIQSKLMASSQLLSTFLEIGLSNALTFFLASRRLEIKQAYGVSVLFSLLSLITLGGFSYFSTQSDFFDLFYPKNNKPQIFIYFLALTAVAEIVRFQVIAIISSQKLFKILNSWEIGSTLFRLAIYFILIFTKDQQSVGAKVEFILYTDLCLSLFVLLGYFVIYSKQIGLRPSFSINYYHVLGDLGKFAGLIYLSNLINFLFIRIDYWIVEHFLGVEGLGVYAVSVSLSTGLSFIPLAMNSVLLPHLLHSPSESRGKIFALYSRFNFSLSFILTILALLIAPIALPFLLGDKYLASIQPFQGLLFGYLFASFKYLLGVYLKVTEQLKLKVFTDFFGLLLCAILSYFLTEKYGLMGTTVAFALAHLLSLLFILLIINRQLKEKLSLFWARQDDWRYFLKIDFFTKT